MPEILDQAALFAALDAVERDARARQHDPLIPKWADDELFLTCPACEAHTVIALTAVDVPAYGSRAALHRPPGIQRGEASPLLDYDCPVTPRLDQQCR